VEVDAEVVLKNDELAKKIQRRFQSWPDISAVAINVYKKRQHSVWPFLSNIVQISYLV